MEQSSEIVPGSAFLEICGFVSISSFNAGGSAVCYTRIDEIKAMGVTTNRKLTADDLLAMRSDGERYELDDGELLEMAPTGPEHGETENEVAFLLTRFVKEHNLGRVWTGDVGFKLLEDRVRAPDVAFLSREQLQRTPKPKRGFYPGTPDLAIEIRSPDDETGALLLKVSRFLSAGTRLVWVVDPERRTVTVYRVNGEVLVLGASDALSGEDVLPGFSCSVSQLFPSGP